MSQTIESAQLWAAVDAITNPTRRKLDRGEREVDLAAEILDSLAQRTRGACSILEKRRADELAAEQELAYGTIPALWDQATWAVTTGNEQTGGSSPLRERSPADLALMETLADIREAVAMQLQGRNVKPKGSVPQQMRQLCSVLVTIGNQEHIDWWTFRYQSWTRVLRTHLNALDHQPKNVYLRNTPCPTCKIRQVTIETDDGEKKVVPAILIDFHDGWIRAATCQSCTASWFRGDDLGRLAELVEQPRHADTA